MKFLLKVAPAVFLNPMLWVVVFYYIKSNKSLVFDKEQKKAVGIGSVLFIVGALGGHIFQDLFTSTLEDKGLYTAEMALYYFQGYYFLWGLISAFGVYKILGVYFQNAISKA